MESLNPTTQMVIFTACIVFALCALYACYQSLIPKRIKIQEPVRHNRFSAFVLLVSAAGWVFLAKHYQPDEDHQFSPDDLPATAAGIPPQPLTLVPNGAAHVAKNATLAEEMAESPMNPDFIKLRNHVSELLFTTISLDQADQQISIDLTQESEGDTIKYLVQERPGLLTLVYNRKESGQEQMRVYFPEIAGDRLIYTPLTGPSSPAITKLVTGAL